MTREPRRHPLHPAFQLPEIFCDLVDFVMDGLDPADEDVWHYASWLDQGGDLFCGDLDTHLLGQPADLDDPQSLCGELNYHFQPLEILPFCWNGGDALHYGWAVLAPELGASDHPCVSFSPMDDHAVWLGDDTKQALESLLVGVMAGWTAWGRERGQQSPDGRQLWRDACRALKLRPDLGSAAITPGARSKRGLRPDVPPGWRYVPTDDGIGVLAEAGAFAPGTIRVKNPGDLDGWRTTARVFLDDGYPGSALAVLKSLSLYEPATVALMREAYGRLGRDLHAERAELWLRLHPE